MGGRANTPTQTSVQAQMWFNKTTTTFKTVPNVEAWVSGSSTINSKQRPGGCGTQTAGLACGGLTAPPASALATTEEYNGSGWSTGGSTNNARRYGYGAGPTTSAFVAGGVGPPGPSDRSTSAENYNGTAWTNSTALPAGKGFHGAAGTQTAGVIYQGLPATTTLEYDGSSWTSSGSVNTNRYDVGHFGTQTAALSVGGAAPSGSPPTSTNVEEYNGSSWTSGGALSTGRRNLGGLGISTAALAVAEAIPEGISSMRVQENGSSGPPHSRSSGRRAVRRAFHLSSQRSEWHGIPGTWYGAGRDRSVSGLHRWQQYTSCSRGSPE